MAQHVREPVERRLEVTTRAEHKAPEYANPNYAPEPITQEDEDSVAQSERTKPQRVAPEAHQQTSRDRVANEQV